MLGMLEREVSIQMVDFFNETQPDILIAISELIHIRESGIPNAEPAEREVNWDHVESLKARDAGELPPILVTRTSIGYIVIDGYHRIAAALAKRRKKIRAEVRPFPNEDEMVEAAFCSNRDHGLPASKENRSAYAWWLHITYPEMEQIEIAKRARISQPTVSKVIKRHYEMGHRQPLPALLEPDDTQETILRNECSQVIDAAWSLYKDLRKLSEEEQRALLSTALSEVDRSMLVALLELVSNLSQP